MEQIKAQWIGKGAATQELYDAETKASNAVKSAAEELMRFKASEGLEMELYRDAIPETLAMLCDTFSGSRELVLFHKED